MPAGDNIDLDGMTKAELLEYAKANDVPGISSVMKKAEIYNLITGCKS